MAIHEGLTITDEEQLSALLRKGVVFRNCNFDEADLRDFDAEEMELQNCSLKKTDFYNLACQSLRIIDSNLERARFEKADIHEATFENCMCESADFSGAKLNLSRMVDCDLSLCDFDKANLFGVDLRGSRLRAVDLSNANLDATRIDRVDFSMGSLRFKKFKKLKLVGVNFTETDLTGCDFTQAEFEDCYLNSALMSEETLFDGADLRGAYISNTHLDTASLKGAIMSAAQAHYLLFEKYGIVVAEEV